MSDRYYLNNMSNGTIVIELSTRRTIEPMTSLPLNDTDVKMFKILRAKRARRASMIDDLRLSKFKIEEDANYIAAHAGKTVEAKEEKPKKKELHKKEEKTIVKEEKIEEKVEDVKPSATDKFDEVMESSKEEKMIEKKQQKDDDVELL